MTLWPYSESDGPTVRTPDLCADPALTPVCAYCGDPDCTVWGWRGPVAVTARLCPTCDGPETDVGTITLD